MSKKRKPMTQRDKEALADVPPQQAIDELKEEIILEVKALSSGKINTVYALVQKGKELIELEKSLPESPVPNNDAQLSEAEF